MTISRLYSKLPLTWKPDNPMQNLNDQRWLASIVRNAAPFTDWWAKARIVQLAYPHPEGAIASKTLGVSTYGGLSEQEIVETLQNCCDSELYPEFARRVNETYVIKTLNDWKAYQFTQAISRNFEVYADRHHPNVFLVVSTAAVSLNVDRILPPTERFRPLFNVDEFAKMIRQRNIRHLTLRTHGYSNPAQSFYRSFCNEAGALYRADARTQGRTLPEDHLYVGYHWPSEQPVTSPGLWSDYHYPGIIFKFLLALSGLAGIVGTALYFLLQFIVVPALRALSQLPNLAPLWEQLNYDETIAYAVRGYWLVPTTFMLWLIAFLLLRIVVYQRDRYRSVHYGSPDLAEFFWRLDHALERLAFLSKSADSVNVSTATLQPQSALSVNLVGHSMGGLLLVNMLRTLSEHGRDLQGSLKPDAVLDPGEDTMSQIGHHLYLDKLILASPDIPLEFLREGRNNYVRSAMRRCRRIYLMSSDRDIVLRYMSTVGNWFTEPSLQMAGMRLGNVYLKRVNDLTNPYRPYLRIMINSRRAVQPTSSYELFNKFNYLDCSEMSSKTGGGVNSVPLPLNPLTALLIDFLNTLIYIVSSILPIAQLDVHGGYFQTDTVAFKILKLLIITHTNDDEMIKAEIEQLIQNTPIRFLPSKPWKMPNAPESIQEQL
jgi:hypothetical protein